MAESMISKSFLTVLQNLILLGWLLTSYGCTLTLMTTCVNYSSVISVTCVNANLNPLPEAK